MGLRGLGYTQAHFVWVGTNSVNCTSYLRGFFFWGGGGGAALDYGYISCVLHTFFFCALKDWCDSCKKHPGENCMVCLTLAAAAVTWLCPILKETASPFQGLSVMELCVSVQQCHTWLLWGANAGPPRLLQKPHTLSLWHWSCELSLRFSVTVSVPLSVCFYLCPTGCLFPCLSVSVCSHACLPICLSLCSTVSPCLSQSLSHCLPVSMSFCLSLSYCLPVCHNLCPTVSLSVSVSVSVPLSPCLSHHLPVSMSVCLSLGLYLICQWI